MKIAPMFGVLLALTFVLSEARAQHPPELNETKSAQIKLEVIPTKKTFAIAKPVAVRYRLTSMVDGTLCFPRPAIEASGSFEGYVSLHARPLEGAGDKDLFIEHFWPVHPSEEELRAKVADQWIRLGMFEPYLYLKVDEVVLDTPGEWELRATYHAPNLTARDKDVVKSMGCTAPEVTVTSDPVVITVVASSN